MLGQSFSIRLITPVMLYECEVWGVEKADILKRLHLKFLQYTMTVKTCNNVIYGKFGRYPLCISIKNDHTRLQWMPPLCKKRPSWKHDVIPSSHIPPSLRLCPPSPSIYPHKSQWEGGIFNQKRKKDGSINPATPAVIMHGSLFVCVYICLHVHMRFVCRHTHTLYVFVFESVCLCKGCIILMCGVSPKLCHRFILSIRCLTLCRTAIK